MTILKVGDLVAFHVSDNFEIRHAIVNFVSAEGTWFTIEGGYAFHMSAVDFVSIEPKPEPEPTGQSAIVSFTIDGFGPVVAIRVGSTWAATPIPSGSGYNISWDTILNWTKVGSLKVLDNGS